MWILALNNDCQSYSFRDIKKELTFCLSRTRALSKEKCFLIGFANKQNFGQPKNKIKSKRYHQVFLQNLPNSILF